MSEKRKFRIMLVDDEPDITTIVKKGLEGEGFDVDAFNDPLKALESFKSSAYDLVILDIKMTPITGFELFRRLLVIDNKVRVCFMTAFEVYHDEFRRVFPTISVDCFVRKPVTIDKLAKIISAQLVDVTTK
jgi:two-component system catabolic regulation response regulator CreB/two-component system response regulator ChvI